MKPRANPEPTPATYAFPPALVWLCAGLFAVACSCGGRTTGSIRRESQATPTSSRSQEDKPAATVLRGFLSALARLDCDEIATFAPPTIPKKDREALPRGCLEHAERLSKLSEVLSHADLSRLEINGARAFLPLDKGGIYMLKLNGRWFVEDIEAHGWRGGE